MGVARSGFTMRLLLPLLLASSSFAVPSRPLRPEEHWRPARARDLSKYKPRHPKVNQVDSPEQAWEKHMTAIGKAARSVQKKRLSPKKRGITRAAECGIEGPPARRSESKIVGGEEAAENQWPWIV